MASASTCPWRDAGTTCCSGSRTPDPASRRTSATASSSGSIGRAACAAGRSAARGSGSRWSSTSPRRMAGRSRSTRPRAGGARSPYLCPCGPSRRGRGQVRKKILVIEDEADIVRGLRDSLEFEGFDVLAATEGKEGIRLAREKSPDCVLLDLMLGDVNGYQVCEEIRAENAVVPIVMLTARSQESDKIRGLEVGADDYVTKPFSIGELIARIKAIFRRLNRLSSEDGFSIGPCEVNVKKHTLTRKGKKAAPLTFYEVELLKLLHERAE